MPKKEKKATQKKVAAIPHNSTKAKETAWKTVSTIQDRWELRAVEMARLLHTKPSTFHSWKEKKEIPVSADPLTPNMEIVVAVIAIYRSLSAMFSNPKDQVAWLNAKHPEFHLAPIKFAESSSPNLFQLRSYLDFIRGRGV